MKYLKSTTQKEYTVMGKIIPRCVTPNNAVLALNDAELTQFKAIPVINSLINSGDILVMNEAPDGANMDTAELVTNVAALRARNLELQTQLQELQKAKGVSTSLAANVAVEKQSQIDLHNAKQEIEKLKAQLAEAQKPTPVNTSSKADADASKKH